MAVQKSNLKKFLDAKKTASRVTGDLERHLLTRPPGNRDYTVLHPSEMIKRDWCRRASYWQLLGEPKLGTKPNLRLQSIFDEGHYIHAKWQKWFQEMGKIHGQFKCDVCDKMTWGTSPEKCEHCGAPEHKLVYAEVTMRDDKLRIKGHTDGWVKGLGDDFLIEIKSVGPGTIRAEAPDLFEQGQDFMTAWKNVKRPFPSHIRQGQMYLELMKRMGMTGENGQPIDEIVFIYELKADQDYKEFTVKADFEIVRHIFDAAKELVEDVEEGIEPQCFNNPGGTCPQCEGYGK